MWNIMEQNHSFNLYKIKYQLVEFFIIVLIIF